MKSIARVAKFHFAVGPRECGLNSASGVSHVDSRRFVLGIHGAIETSRASDAAPDSPRPVGWGIRLEIAGD
jgi:hypothetical protein